MYSSNHTQLKKAAVVPSLDNYEKWLEKLEQCLVDLVENEPYCDLNLVVEFKEVKDNPAVLAAAQRIKMPYTYPKLGLSLPTIDEEKAVKLAKGFTALKDLGATFKEHPALYLRMSEKADDADKLANGFTVLKDSGATFPEHLDLYLGMIENAHLANQLANRFIALQDLGATFPEHPELYQEMMKNGRYSEHFINGFNLLNDYGFTLTEHKSLYLGVINNMGSFLLFPNAFEILLDCGFTSSQHSELYLKVINKINHTHFHLLEGLQVLRSSGFTLSEDTELYEAVLQNTAQAYELANLFKILKEHGAVFSINKTLYQDIIQNPFHVENSKLLFECGSTLHNHEEFLRFIIENPGSKMPAEFRLLTMFSIGFRMPKYTEFFESILKLDDFGAAELLWLEEKQFTLSSHEYIYNAFFLGSEPLARSPYNLSKVKLYLDDCVVGALLSKTDEGYIEQCAAVEKAIDHVLNEASELTEGPLEKTNATRILEALLVRISTTELDAIDMRFDESFGYILQFHGDSEIYLSELLTLVNFAHIALDDEQISNLGAKIQTLSGNDRTQRSPQNRIVSALPEAARDALESYFGDVRYKNINRLFRGIEQTSEERYTWIPPVNHKENLLANFLCGCLVNWSANALCLIFLNGKERSILRKTLLNTDELNVIKESEISYENHLNRQLQSKVITQEEFDAVKGTYSDLDLLFPAYGLIDRSEDLLSSESEKNGHLAVSKRRLANPTYVSGVMSLSVFKTGSKYFQKKDAVRTKIETSNLHRPVVNPREGEILIPHGTTYRYSQNQGMFFAQEHRSPVGFCAREINSPSIVHREGYWSSIALVEAYRLHLSRPYQNNASLIILDGTTIQRPNHGLAHTYRVMTYLDIVINYFAHHAQDELFQAFCQTILPNEREWLRVAAAYSITGRESEISAHENLSLYDQFRDKSAENLRLFLKQHSSSMVETDDAMSERILHIVRWMGNPFYEIGREGEPPINTHDDLDERQHRNFIHRILTVAHKLDLCRCYGPQAFMDSMKGCRDVSKTNEEQKTDYTHMIRYAIDLNAAHGNKVCTQMTESGDLEVCYDEGYRPPFDKVSTNLRQLREMSETVTYPKLKESYQFKT